MKLSMNASEFFAILPDLLPFLIPIFLIMLLLIAAALINLLKKEVIFSKKIVWIFIILFLNLLGPILYFAIGSKMLDEETHN